ncbi:Uncharacterised protein [Mycobacteroides abscessus subsp. abscessus]|nr:Uncharacterised protein [Mycobacteroides abscessus subsp. abscessus]SIC80037.1 Uncharacterised protein [Mycobacteroides abscessus subsp. abscessus]SKK32643.1 Uncharacterised protein [Mycobacteroides abscessus subsp. abscessus]SKP26304.1 Uncharacterised protein [Mycobacteroides abscessus subsp. abscessus]
MGSYEASLRRKDAWRKIHFTCPCGREVFGNGKSHQRSCETHLRERGWPLDNGMVDAVIREYRGRNPVPRIRAAELALGRLYLERRRKGDKAELGWSDYRDMVWSAASDDPPGLGREKGNRDGTP